jgi:hypothetical protein
VRYYTENRQQRSRMSRGAVRSRGAGEAVRSSWITEEQEGHDEHSGAGNILPINPILVLGHFDPRSSYLKMDLKLP